jgi:hypothetical protein
MWFFLQQLIIWLTMIRLQTREGIEIFLRDRDTDNDGLFDEPGNVTTTRISKGYDGSEANNDSWEVSISYDGRFIAIHLLPTI